MLQTPAIQKKKNGEKERKRKARVARAGKKKTHINTRIERARRASQRGEVVKREGGGVHKVKKPDIDVIIPISGTMYLPHLKNCLLAISGQTFPGREIGITVSCVMHEEIDVQWLGQLCMRHEATLVFTKQRHTSFSRGFALNVGVRQGSRSHIAFIDADVFLHRTTLEKAVAQCASAVMAVIPVARTGFGPGHQVWTKGNLKKDDFWTKVVSGLPYAKGGYGNAVLQRAVFESVHGHDERFFGWGGIDTDIYFRMLKSGRVVDMDDVNLPRALHQKHETPPSKKNPECTVRNRRLLDENHSIVRNPERWGRVRCR